VGYTDPSFGSYFTSLQVLRAGKKQQEGEKMWMVLMKNGTIALLSLDPSIIPVDLKHKCHTAAGSVVKVVI
tara:strand:- start:308 stop:520 length:213 start_codon:yes stop_codon:yes gene_type:complete